MLAEQEDRCGLCRGEMPRPCVDHNHLSGKVRALLCVGCNTKLEAIENEQFMLLARDYLRRHDGYEFTKESGL